MPSPVRDWAFETERGDVVKTNATGSFIGQWSCFCYGIMGNLKDTWKKKFLPSTNTGFSGIWLIWKQFCDLPRHINLECLLVQ